MTLEDIKAIEREYLLPREVAAVLGTDGQSIRICARQAPQRLGFPTICIGHRVKIPKSAFIRFMEGNTSISEDTEP